MTSVPNPAYNVFGLLNGLTFGSNDTDAFTYDPSTGRMTQYQATINGTQSITGALTWNANGSLRQLSITDTFNAANAQTCTYAHDDLARLSQVDCGSGKWGQSYTYGTNNFGNVNWSVLSGRTGTAFPQAYDPATNHFQGLGSYDANGNLTSDGAHTYSWDADGRLYQLTDAGVTMTYDALGRRVEQATGSVYNEILYGPGGSKLALINGSTQAVSALFLPLPGGATAVYDATGLKRYRHADWLGSSRLSSTPTRTVSYDGAYSPIGESYAETGTTDRNFTGQNQDLATDLYDFLYREYRPAHGRWISPDPAGVAAVNPANPQSWNRYAYVSGSPLNSVDPQGLSAKDPYSPECTGKNACADAAFHSSLSAGGAYNLSLIGVGTATFWSAAQDTAASPAQGTSNFCYDCPPATFSIDTTVPRLPDIPPPDFYSFSAEAGPLAYSFSWVPSTRNAYHSMGGGSGSGVSVTAGWMLRGDPSGFLGGPSGNGCYFYGAGGCVGASLSGEVAVQAGLGLGRWGVSAGSGIDPVQILKDMLLSHPVDGPLATKTDTVYMDDETGSWLQMVPR